MDDQSGADRYTTEVVLQKFHGELVMLDPKPRMEDRGNRRAS
jgi:single-stranded DNA-binding protein